MLSQPSLLRIVRLSVTGILIFAALSRLSSVTAVPVTPAISKLGDGELTDVDRGMAVDSYPDQVEKGTHEKKPLDAMLFSPGDNENNEYSTNEWPPMDYKEDDQDEEQHHEDTPDDDDNPEDDPEDDSEDESEINDLHEAQDPFERARQMLASISNNGTTSHNETVPPASTLTPEPSPRESRHLQARQARQGPPYSSEFYPGALPYYGNPYQSYPMSREWPPAESPYYHPYRHGPPRPVETSDITTPSPTPTLPSDAGNLASFIAGLRNMAITTAPSNDGWQTPVSQPMSDWTHATAPPPRIVTKEMTSSTDPFSRMMVLLSSVRASMATASPSPTPSPTN